MTIVADCGGGLATTYLGSRRRLAAIALTTGCLSILTLGLYLFVGTVRLRRWHWSAMRPGGQPLEYTGNPLDLFASAIAAVAVLVFWLVILVPSVTTASIALSGHRAPGWVIGGAALLPLWYWVRYRARAGRLAQTRWRGLRFGVVQGEVGYALRAVWHWFVTILSLGVLWPRMTFALEKYRTDRTFFGTARFEQGGRWRVLWSGFVPVYLTGIGCAAALVAGLSGAPAALWLLIPLGGALVGAAVAYRVRSLGIMASEKRLAGLRLSVRPSPARVGRIIGFGGLSAVILGLLPAVGAGIVALSVWPGDLSVVPDALMALGPPGWAVLVVLAAAQVAMLLLAVVAWQTLVTAPVQRHYAESVTLYGASALHDIRARPSTGEHRPAAMREPGVAS